MILCVRFEGSVTTHWALALSAPSANSKAAIIILYFIIIFIFFSFEFS